MPPLSAAALPSCVVKDLAGGCGEIFVLSFYLMQYLHLFQWFEVLPLTPLRLYADLGV